jgi:fucose permease
VGKRVSIFLLPVIYLGYISLGLPDGTLGVAWPWMHKELGLSFDFAGKFMFLVTLLSVISSLSSGRVIARFKTGPVVLVSCIMTAAGLMCVSLSSGMAPLLLAALPLGLGAGAVDASLNGYVAKHYSRRHMNWLHACWGIGATCGPLIMTESLHLGNGWRGGFVQISLIQFSLAAIFLLTLGLWERQPEARQTSTNGEAADATGKHRAMSEAGILSLLGFLLYIAAEGTTGLWTNSVLVMSRHVSQQTAGLCVTAFYASITVGRIAVGFAPAHWSGRRLIFSGLLLAFSGALLFTFGKTEFFALPSLIMLGFGFAPVYPGLMHEVPRRFQPDAVQSVIGLQSAGASFGAAVVPVLAGWLAVHTGLETIPLLILAAVLALIICLQRLNKIS